MYRLAQFIKRNKKGLMLVAIFAVLVFVLSLDIKVGKDSIEVGSIYPPNGAQGVSLTTEITINFENSVPSENRRDVFVRVVPGMSFTEAWETDKILKLYPDFSLLPSTKYEVTVSYEDRAIYSSVFNTRVMKAYSEEEIEEINVFADETAKAFYEFAEKYPFAPKMPLRSDTYYIVYDYDLEKFRVKLLLSESAPEEEKQRALNEAEIALGKVVSEVTEDTYYVLYME